MSIATARGPSLARAWSRVPVVSHVYRCRMLKPARVRQTCVACVVRSGCTFVDRELAPLGAL
eukprot:13975512-Alexandrium_andersonii.AAC.1